MPNEEKNNKLSSFYKNNVLVFYNIDMIEHKYKQYSRYKTIPEISKYIKNEIFELKQNGNYADFTIRNIVKIQFINYLINRLLRKKLQ